MDTTDYIDYSGLIRSAKASGTPTVVITENGNVIKGYADTYQYHMPASRMTIDATAKPVIRKGRHLPPSDICRNGADAHKIKVQLKEILKRYDRSGIPDWLLFQQNADFYIALISYEFTHHTSKGIKEAIILAIEGDVDDVHFWQENPPCENIITWASKRLNRTPVVAVSVVGEILGIKPEHCFKTFPPSARPNKSKNSSTKLRDLTPTKLEVNGNLFKLMAKDVHQNFASDVEQAVCHYSNGVIDIYILAVRHVDDNGHASLKIGAGAASAYLFSRNLMAYHRSATILICPDIHTSMKFRQIAREARLLDRAGIIVSGYAGKAEALTGLLLSDVVGHKVVIAISPGQERWDEVTKLAEGCMDNGATDVSIYPYPLVTGEPQNIARHAIQALLEESSASTIDLDAVEMPSQVATRIIRNAVSFNNFSAWKKAAGLAPLENSLHEQDRKPEIRFTPFSELPNAPCRERGQPITVREMFNAHNTSLFWGPSNAGKSWLGIDAAVSMATGTPYLYWQESSPCRVGYLDAEVGPDFKGRGLQLIKRRESCLSLLNKNLFVLPIKGGMNLTNAETQSRVIGELRTAKVEHLFIDNVLSLAPAASKSNAKPLFDFIHEVEALGIGVTVLHHADKTGKDFKGPVDLVSLCQNVIHLEGRDQIEAELSKEDSIASPQLQAALNDDGPTVRMTVDKCKVAPELERRQMVYRLRVGEAWEFIEGDLSPVSIVRSDESLLTMESATLPAHTVPLPPDALKLLNSMTAGNSYSRPDLEAAANFKEDRVRKALKLLLDSSFILKAGEGKATYYYKA